MFDKSKDYLVQTSSISIWYLEKTAEGSAAFNTDSEAAFKASAKQVDYVVKSGSSLTSGSYTEGEDAHFNVWREVWLTAGFTALPKESAKLFAEGKFWIVQQVEYLDRDDSGEQQRYRLTCKRSKRKAVE